MPRKIAGALFGKFIHRVIGNSECGFIFLINTRKLPVISLLLQLTTNCFTVYGNSESVSLVIVLEKKTVSACVTTTTRTWT